MVDERHELDGRDLTLLRQWGLRPGVDPPRERRIVLVGRLQRALGGVIVDGQYGPHTRERLRAKRLSLGSELSSIVSDFDRGRR